VLLGGLALSFSRGAWAHFAISAAVAMVSSCSRHARRPAHARPYRMFGAAAAAIAGMLLVIA
jgi:hypothetical protein